MSPDLFERVQRIIARYREIPVEVIKLDSTLEDLGLDSIGAMEFLFEIEEEFKILVPTERKADFTTVRAVCEGIETLLKAGAAG